jgi:hypothetical protein
MLANLIIFKTIHFLQQHLRAAVGTRGANPRVTALAPIDAPDGRVYLGLAACVDRSGATVAVAAGFDDEAASRTLVVSAFDSSSALKPRWQVKPTKGDHQWNAVTSAGCLASSLSLG